MLADDKAAGMVGSIAEVFPKAAYQRCTVHLYKNGRRGSTSPRGPASSLCQDHPRDGVAWALRGQDLEVAAGFEEMRLREISTFVREGYAETLRECCT